MSEIRRDALRGGWVIVAPERARRPRDFTPAPSAPSDRSVMSLLRRTRADRGLGAAGVASDTHAREHARVGGARGAESRAGAARREQSRPGRRWLVRAVRRPWRARSDHRVAASHGRVADDDDGCVGACAVGVARADPGSQARLPAAQLRHRQESRRGGRREDRSSALAALRVPAGAGRARARAGGGVAAFRGGGVLRVLRPAAGGRRDRISA